MKQEIRIERRLPFGFRGDWGIVYKAYTSDIETQIDEAIIKYQRNYYRDMGEWVQFKLADDITRKKENIMPNVIMGGETAIIKTTDAYWNCAKEQFDCIVFIGDIVKVFNEFWLIQSMHIKTLYTPAPQRFYYLEAKKIICLPNNN